MHEPQVVILPECRDRCGKLSRSVGEALLSSSQDPDGQYSVICGKTPGKFGACHSEVFKRGSYIAVDGHVSFVESSSDIDQSVNSGTVRARVREALSLGAIDMPIEDLGVGR